MLDCLGVYYWQAEGHSFKIYRLFLNCAPYALLRYAGTECATNPMTISINNYYHTKLIRESRLELHHVFAISDESTASSENQRGAMLGLNDSFLEHTRITLYAIFIKNSNDSQGNGDEEFVKQ